MEVQVLSSAPRIAAVLVLLSIAIACSRSSELPTLTGSLTSDPPVLLAPLGDRPDGVVHGRLIVRAGHEVPAGSTIRIVQGYDENGRWLGGAELRYGLPPVPALGGRAHGVGARIVERGGGRELGLVAVAPLAPESGWLAIRLDRPLPPDAELEILLGDPKQPSFGPPSNLLPLEVELAAEIAYPAAPESWRRLDGRVWVRSVPAEADWLRVIVPAQAASGAKCTATVLFMAGFSGPQRSSAEALVPAGELELSGPFPPIKVPVAAEAPSPDPQSVRVELPPFPPGLHRIAARFRGARELRGLSNPIRVGGDEMPTWFGSIHGHTVVGGHATSTPSRALRYAREVSALDFVALSEHREAKDFDGAWLAALAESESRADRFVVFTAWEWTDARAGHRHVLARAPRLPPDSPPDLRSFATSVARDPDLLVVGHHSLWNGGTAQKRFDWGEPGQLPRQLLAEVYSWHGCSLAHESDFPLHGNHDQEFPPELHTDVCSALARGHRLFLIADSDNHFGKPGCLVGIEWPRGRRYAYHGLVAVRAPALTRDALFHAMESGSVYGTTGARMLVSAQRRGGEVAVSVAGTAPIARVSLRSPERQLATKEFEAVAADAGKADAPLFLDPGRGTWDAQVVLAAADAPVEDPWIVEVAQQDFHHAWLLLPPESWSR